MFSPRAFPHIHFWPWLDVAYPALVRKVFRGYYWNLIKGLFVWFQQLFALRVVNNSSRLQLCLSNGLGARGSATGKRMPFRNIPSKLTSAGHGRTTLYPIMYSSPVRADGSFLPSVFRLRLEEWIRGYTKAPRLEIGTKSGLATSALCKLHVRRHAWLCPAAAA